MLRQGVTQEYVQSEVAKVASRYSAISSSWDIEIFSDKAKIRLIRLAIRVMQKDGTQITHYIVL